MPQRRQRGRYACCPVVGCTGWLWESRCPAPCRECGHDIPKQGGKAKAWQPPPAPWRQPPAAPPAAPGPATTAIPHDFATAVKGLLGLFGALQCDPAIKQAIAAVEQMLPTPPQPTPLSLWREAVREAEDRQRRAKKAQEELFRLDKRITDVEHQLLGLRDSRGAAEQAVADHSRAHAEALRRAAELAPPPEARTVPPGRPPGSANPMDIEELDGEDEEPDELEVQQLCAAKRAALDEAQRIESEIQAKRRCRAASPATAAAEAAQEASQQAERAKAAADLARQRDAAVAGLPTVVAAAGSSADRG